jgi:HupF/HypC family
MTARPQSASHTHAGQPRPCAGEEDTCITCSDTASRMLVLEVDGLGELAICVDEQGRRRRVDTGIVGEVLAGDTLLVHAGTALFREPA